MYSTSWARQIVGSPTSSRLGKRLVEGTLSTVLGCSNQIYLKIPPSHLLPCIMFSELINRVTQVSVKSCWWGPAGHYTERRHSVNPCAFAGRLLSHLVLFSSPRCSQSSERGLGWPGSLALIGMWHGANVWGDYLPGFREAGGQLWSTEWCWSLSTLRLERRKKKIYGRSPHIFCALCV